MPRLACWSRGRRVDVTSPLESLAVDERRCPRWGALINVRRRDGLRRQGTRRRPR